MPYLVVKLFSAIGEGDHVRDTASAEVARVGVTQAQLAVQRDLGWLFREQPTDDYGIDAQVEVVKARQVSGRLLALQIKSGRSFFKEPGPGGWWFRPEAKHVQYWTRHSLPVVIVLYDPDSELCHWGLVNKETLVGAGAGGWKLLIPERQVLSADAAGALSKAAEGDPYQLRIRELQLARPWMDLLASGKRLVIDVEEWINKTSGRGSISLGIDNEDGKSPEHLAEWAVFLGMASYVDVVPTLFAWADISLHEETYDDAEFGLYSWEVEDRHVLHPYENGAGEVDHYRFELMLNELGKSFLAVDQFAAEGTELLTV